MTHRRLHFFAVLTALATLFLIGIGGLVTSHGVGMAVPDWPNTYGYNLFFFPISQWVGGVFYEHTHRLAASAVGLLTCVLALWLHGAPARRVLRWAGTVLAMLGLGIMVRAPGHGADALVLGSTGIAGLLASFFWPRCEPAPKWLRRLGVIAFLAVILQGVLGGLRVVLFKDQIGIFHAALAQGFFVLLCSLVVFTSPRWSLKDAGMGSSGAATCPPAALPGWFLLGTILILGQLLVGATMRHQHAGLAIPDFPLAYGKWWPAMDGNSIAHYNQQRIEVTESNPITAFQIGLQMVHRLMAAAIVGAVALCAWLTRRRLGAANLLSRWSLIWLGLILSQALLGAATIWSNKAADVATIHVLIGALSLALGSILSLLLLRALVLSRRLAKAPSKPRPFPLAPLGSHPLPVPGLR